MGTTVKSVALESEPAAVRTSILPVVAPLGTTAFRLVAEDTVTWAATPLNFTALLLSNPDPSTVTEIPAGPLAGVKPVAFGSTSKSVALVPVPSGFSMESRPVVAVAGTVAVIRVLLTTVKEAVTPLNFTLVAPVNSVPSIVTVSPAAVLAGVKLDTVGGLSTMKSALLLPV